MSSPGSWPQEGSARGLLQFLRNRIEAREGSVATDDDFYDNIERKLRSGALGSRPLQGPALTAFVIVLKALSWRGTDRAIAEALPHDAEFFDDLVLFDVLARLGINARAWSANLVDVDPRLCPVLVVRPDGATDVILSIDSSHAEVFAFGVGCQTVPVSTLQGKAFTIAMADDLPDLSGRSFLGILLWRQRHSVALLIFVTMSINVIALAVPFAMSALYDSVIPGRAIDSLLAIVIGVFLAGFFEYSLRSIKARAIGFVSGRLDYLVSTQVFQKLLSLPFEMTATLPTGSQVAKLKQFENLREVFAGPLVAIALELPFIIMVLVGLLVLAPPLAIGPAVVAIIFIVVGAAMLPLLKHRSAEAGRQQTLRQNLLLDTFGHMRTIRASRAEDQWLARLEAACAATTIAQRKAAYLSSILQNIGQMAVPIAGVSTITFGTALVLNNQLTVGGLVAGMMLVWRVLGPMQMLFLTAIRLSEIAQSLTQLNHFMTLRTENAGSALIPWQRQISGELKLVDIGYRYPRASEPAIVGVNLSLAPGELVAVMGTSGSGKSTLLRIMIGLVQPQGGSVLLDGVNIRQFDASQVRSVIGYVPQMATFFAGSILQNMRLAAPAASIDDIRTALADVGVLQIAEALPNGLETLLSDSGHEISDGLKQSLILAQALLRKPRLLLLDEPAQALDPQLDAALVNVLRRLKGETTVVMVTHRPSHAGLADKVAVLDRGRLVGVGEPAVVLPKLERMFGDAA